MTHVSKVAVTHLTLTARKYRDERRPRHGLLRSREFIMKDLYTFDHSPILALETYHQVRAAYARLFDELKLPYLVAEADSGDIGGDLSHEFHFPTSKGEDHVISCSKCDYVANEELAESPAPKTKAEREAPYEEPGIINVWRGISQDRLTLVNVWFAWNIGGKKALPDYVAPGGLEGAEVNARAVKAVLPELDSSVDDPLPFWEHQSTAPRQLINLFDHSLSNGAKEFVQSGHNPNMFPESMSDTASRTGIETTFKDSSNEGSLNLLRIRDGDACPRCAGGTLRVQKAIELGHTFHLGTRYSEPLEANVKVPAEVVAGRAWTSSPRNDPMLIEVPMQMGCHGIGVSRMIGAVADTLADEKGLNWPRVMAPFEVVIVSGKGLDEAAQEVYDALGNGEMDIILDDRKASFPWKMQDADLIGYPVIVVVGRGWNTDKKCEVQCRRLDIRREVPFAELPATVNSLLEQL